MANTPTHFKLGLFALGAIVGVFAAAFTLGIRTSRSATVTYHTYFDESVQGLDLGASVKYRGVTIGSVTAIDVASDRRHIDVSLALAERDVRRLGLATPPPKLRAHLAIKGITGLKFIDFDFGDSTPPAALGFVPAARSLPVEVSLFQRLENRSDQLGRDAEQLLASAIMTLHRIDGVLDDVQAQRLPARVAGVLDRTGDGIADVRRLVRSFQGAEMPAKATAALDGVTDATAALRRIIDRLDGPDGLVSAARRSFDAIGDVGRGARGSADELGRTIRDLGEAARGVQEFFEQLDRDPDMLVKGRGKPKGR